MTAHKVMDLSLATDECIHNSNFFDQDCDRSIHNNRHSARDSIEQGRGKLNREKRPTPKVRHFRPPRPACHSNP